VVELIDQDSNWWNLSLILEIFHEEEGRRICKIPLSHVQSKDVMIWCSTTNGEFSVRSAYYMEKALQDTWRSGSPRQQDEDQVWKIIRIIFYNEMLYLMPLICPICERGEKK
jgi:hypothetical protein